MAIGSTETKSKVRTARQIHLIKLLNPTTFLYMAVDRSQSNLAIVRSAVSRHAKELN